MCVSLCVRVPEERDLIHYRVSLEAHERESSLWVLKFILFLSAPIRLTNPSAACVQMIPEDSESTHQSYLRLSVHGVESGRLHLKGLPQGSQKVLIKGKLQRQVTGCNGETKVCFTYFWLLLCFWWEINAYLMDQSSRVKIGHQSPCDYKISGVSWWCHWIFFLL